MMSYILISYIGPGAGFAFIGSFLILLSALALVLIALISWPFRAFLSLLFRKNKKRKKTSVRRIIILGLDGMDYGRTEKLIRQGRLPFFQQLQKDGSFLPLKSTCPPISPVAWSSFMTGANPGKHNIFDFLNRDLRTYLPELSSSQIHWVEGKPVIRLLRKSKPFWHALGEHGVMSTTLRVPITYPPEKFNGMLLSGMCVPDLLGSQGTFFFFSESSSSDLTGGVHYDTVFNKNRATVLLEIPTGEHTKAKLPLHFKKLKNGKSLFIKAGRTSLTLKQGAYSDWVQMPFKSGPFKTVRGICKLYLKSSEPTLQLYMTPIHIDPEKPALPISHPGEYSIYLSKLIGSYATLGLAEDTWAMNEGIIDDATFLDQVYDIHAERKTMFFESIKRIRKGVITCVFDTPDRIQHMFMRQGFNEHDPHEKTIDEMYEKMDRLARETMNSCGKNDVLFIISDHGFTRFERGVNLNAWLMKKGYLNLQENAEDDDYLRNIDWSQTKAYSFGLSGIYLNMKGRESKGIVEAGEVDALKRAIAEELLKLKDPKNNEQALHAVHDAEKVYSGPYRNNGPDLITGFNKGYRASWDSATGKTSEQIFSDNEKAWSGDHCVDVDLVPGIFFSNKTVNDDRELWLGDLAPTVLELMGISPPAYMDGEVISLNLQSRAVKEAINN